MTDALEVGQPVKIVDDFGIDAIGQKPMAQSIPVVIAEDQSVTTNVEGDLWQMGVRAGKGFTVVLPPTIVANATETDMLYLVNPVGSGKKLRCYFIAFGFNGTSTDKSTLFRLYRNPTVTVNGTALTVKKLKTSGNTPVILAYSAPTVTVRGTLCSLGNFDFTGTKFDLNLGIYIEAGESALITLTPQVPNKEHFIVPFWLEDTQ